MKVVFLDIDGVLNTSGDKVLINNMVEINKLNNLVKLLNITKANLVIISDRRLLLDERNNIDDIFDKYEIIVNFLSYKRTHRKRSDEILFYLENNKTITHYVILDDNDLGYSDSIMKNSFVNTYINGFDNAKYNEALMILNGA